MSKKVKTSCPQCGKKDTWKTDNVDRPFCSARCKLIDLGAWADEKHVIPGDQKISSEDDENNEL